MLLPALIFIGVAGWCMYALGDNYKTTQNKPTRLTQKENVILLPTFLDDHQEIKLRIKQSTPNFFHC